MKQEITPKKGLRLIGHGPVVLVTTINHARKTDITPLAWITPISQEPAMLALALHPESYGHELIMETKEFVVNVPNAQLLDEIRLCGTTSGRDMDKFEVTGLTPIPALRVQAPLIRQCIGHIECELHGTVPVGDHTLFVARIVAASADDEAFDGFLKTEEPIARTLHHLGGDWYVSPGKRFMPQ